MSDVQLTANRQLEDNLTRALIVTLAELGVPSRHQFLHDVCGVEDVAAAAAVVPELQLQPLPIDGRKPAQEEVLLGISPNGGIAPGTLDIDHGGSRADALATFGPHAIIVIESKAVGACEGAQLARHAHAWGLDEPGPQGPPSTWPMRTWQDLADWARGSVAAEPGEVGRFLLTQFADYLDLAGVTARSTVAITASRQAEQELALPAWIEDLAAAVDLDSVAHVCATLYGDEASEYYVSGDGRATAADCRTDSRRVLTAYREAHEEVPPVLLQRGGDVITPRRALSILYGPDDYVASIADPQTSARAGKLIGSGADRAVLLGMLAWAWDRPGKRPQLLRQIVATTWPRAPARTYAVPELHEALGAGIVAALNDPAKAAG